MWLTGLVHIAGMAASLHLGMVLYQYYEHHFVPEKARMCFVAETADPQLLEHVSCVLAQPGEYPPVQSELANRKQCCFDGEIVSGVFWAIGKHGMSRLISLNKPSNEYHFKIEPVRQVLFHIVDEVTGEPVPYTHITVADDLIHLVSYQKVSNKYGYVVVPVIRGQKYMMTIRANDYLPARPVVIDDRMTDDAENPEHVIKLDAGVSLGGVVRDDKERPVEGARLHIDVVKSDGGVWNSEIDLPKPVSALANWNKRTWFPRRSVYRTDSMGRFNIHTLPAGKVRIFATHNNYPPSRAVSLNINRTEEVSTINLQFTSPKRAWIRVENSVGSAIRADLTVTDRTTGFEMYTVHTPSSGSMELKVLPEQARLRVISGGMVPYEIDKNIQDNDEILIKLDNTLLSIDSVVKDSNYAPLKNVTLSIADKTLQKSYPMCLSKTDRSGEVSLSGCPEGFWLDIYHPDYARQLIFITGRNIPREILLSEGKSIVIQTLDNGQQVEASCNFKTIYTFDDKEYVIETSAKSQDGKIRLEHQSDNISIDLSCKYGNAEVHYKGQVPSIIEFPHQIRRSLVVLDSFGAPLEHARVVLNDHSEETDDHGHLEILAQSGQKLDVYHWLHGHAVAEWQEGTGEIEIHLPDKPSEALISCLSNHKIPYITDSSIVYISENTDKYHIRRGDMAESCDSRGMVIVRDGKRKNVSW